MPGGYPTVTVLVEEACKEYKEKLEAVTKERNEIAIQRDVMLNLLIEKAHECCGHEKRLSFHCTWCQRVAELRGIFPDSPVPPDVEYAAVDEETIWGLGNTPEEAFEDAIDYIREAYYYSRYIEFQSNEIHLRVVEVTHEEGVYIATYGWDNIPYSRAIMKRDSVATKTYKIVEED